MEAGRRKVTIMRTARVRYLVQAFVGGKIKHQDGDIGNKSYAIDKAMEFGTAINLFPDYIQRRVTARRALG